MATPAWFWPTGAAALTVGTALTSEGVVVPDWRSDTFQVFSGTAFSTALTGAAALYPGISSVAAGASGDAWAVGFTGALSYITSGVAQSGLPTGTYTGVAIASGAPYLVTSAGALLNSAGAAVGPGLGLAPAWGLAGSATLYTLLASQGELGTFTASSGATGTLALPAALATPYCVAVSGANVAVGGASAAALVSGAGQTAFSLNPANTSVLLGVKSGAATVWLGSAANAWSYQTSVSGIGAAGYAAWVPTGTQALVTNGSAVEVLSYSASTLAIQQTISLTNAGAVVVIADSTDALVAQPSSSQVTPLSATGSVWATTAPVTGLGGIGPLAVTSPSQVVAGVTNAIKFLNLSGGAWTIGSSVALTFTPSVLAVDGAGAVYAAGAGALAVITSGAVTGTGTWSGTANGIVVSARQVAIADSTSGLIRVFGSDNGTTWTQRTSVALPASFTGFGQAGQSVFASGTGTTNILNFSAPYTLASVKRGAAGWWNGSAWTTVDLGVNHTPSAITVDGSGNAQIGTVQNDLYGLTPGGTLTTGIVPQYQAQAVPLGVSALCASGAALYAGTSMAGALVQIR